MHHFTSENLNKSQTPDNVFQIQGAPYEDSYCIFIVIDSTIRKSTGTKKKLRSQGDDKSINQFNKENGHHIFAYCSVINAMFHDIIASIYFSPFLAPATSVPCYQEFLPGLL